MPLQILIVGGGIAGLATVRLLPRLDVEISPEEH